MRGREGGRQAGRGRCKGEGEGGESESDVGTHFSIVLQMQLGKRAGYPARFPS
jgi:hypothetical protein